MFPCRGERRLQCRGLSHAVNSGALQESEQNCSVCVSTHPWGRGSRRARCPVPAFVLVPLGFPNSEAIVVWNGQVPEAQKAVFLINHLPLYPLWSTAGATIANDYMLYPQQQSS